MTFISNNTSILEISNFRFPHIRNTLWKRNPTELSLDTLLLERLPPSTRCKFDAFPRDCRCLPFEETIFPSPFRWKTRNRISLEPAWQSFGSMPSLTIDFELSSFPRIFCKSSNLGWETRSFRPKGNDLSISNGNSRGRRVYFTFATRQRKILDSRFFGK